MEIAYRLQSFEVLLHQHFSVSQREQLELHQPQHQAAQSQRHLILQGDLITSLQFLRGRPTQENHSKS